MSIGDKVKSVMSAGAVKSTTLASALGISTQALSNKFYRDSFSAEDLIIVAECANCELAFLSADGSKTVLNRADIKPKKKKEE